MLWGREYWKIYRGPGYLAVIWFGSSPAPPPLPSVSSGNTQEERQLAELRGGGGEGPNHTTARMKARSSINHSLFSALGILMLLLRVMKSFQRVVDCASATNGTNFDPRSPWSPPWQGRRGSWRRTPSAPAQRLLGSCSSPSQWRCLSRKQHFLQIF